MDDPPPPTYEELQARLVIAEDTLGAIRRGEVDALVVQTAQGEQMFTVEIADAFYRVLLEAMPLGVASLDREGTILFANPQLTRMLEMPNERVVGQHITDFLPPGRWAAATAALARGADETLPEVAELANAAGETFTDFVYSEDRERTEAEVIRLAEGGRGTISFENRYRTKSGAYRWLEWNVRPVAAQGLLYAVARDVTDRRRADEEIQHLIEERDLTLASAGVGIYRVDTEGRATYVNPAAAAMIGCPAAELLGRHMHDVTHHTRKDGSAYPAEDCPIYAAIADGEIHSASDELFWTVDGQSFPVEYTSTPTREHGEITGAVAIFSDISDRIRAEEDAARARAASDRIAMELGTQHELSLDLIATVGFDGSLTSVNPAWGSTLGFTAADLLSRPFIDLVHPEDRTRTETEIRRAVSEQTDAVRFNARFRTEAGSYRWLEWNARLVAEHELMYARGRDISDRVRAEEDVRSAHDEADRANLAKSEFLSRMSHELRTPLNAILGFGQLLEMNDLQERDGESVTQILRAGHHLLGLIDEVLDISRIEAGTMRLSVEPVDVVSAMGEVVALMVPVAAEQGIEISTTPGALGECYVLADRQRLRQVIFNLVSNAVKYNRPGGSVDVSFERDEQRVKITVADTGHGIAPDRLNRLFVAFDRLGAESGDVQGTGLGLALSKSLAEQMGGTLTAQSTPGSGSVFTVELEAAANPVDQDRLTSARTTGAESQQAGSGTVLYIDDNPSNIKLVEHALAGQPDLRLILAMQGRTGLELAKAHRPDLILLDLHLPDIDGAAVLERLQSNPGTAAIPVIVLSADANVRQLRALMAGGARAYLTKPLDVGEFLAVVDEHLPREDTPDD